MGLQRTRQQNHSIESIRDTMVDLREAYPNAGAREMVSLLFHEKDMSVSRYLICFLLTCSEFDQKITGTWSFHTLLHMRRAWCVRGKPIGFSADDSGLLV